MSDMLQLVNAAQADVWVTGSAMLLRQAALEKSNGILIVQSADDQAAAVPVLQQLKLIRQRTEESREQVKAPVLELGKKIDSLARKFLADIDLGIDRLGRLLSDYQSRERKLAEAAERARLAELARLAEEQRTAEETARVARESQMRQAVSSEPPALDQSVYALDAELTAMIAEVKRERLEATGPVTAPRAAGMVVREIWRYEVTDIQRVYADRPGLVSLVPMHRKIRSAINDGMHHCPGMRIWCETVADVRGGAL